MGKRSATRRVPRFWGEGTLRLAPHVSRNTDNTGYDNFTRSRLPNIRAKGRPLPQVAGSLSYEEPLAELREYIQYASCSPSAMDHSLSAHQLLLECYSNRYGGIDGEYHVVFAWLYRMEEEFLEALQRHEAVPLVLYAHFALLMIWKAFGT